MVTSVLNRVNVIEKCIKSVRSQLVPADCDIVHIIRDGGSTDGTFEKIKQFSSDMTFHLDVYQGTDTGLYDGLNKTIALAKNFDLLLVLHSDDIFCDQHVVMRIIDFSRKNQADVYCGDVEFVKKTKIHRVWQSKPKYLKYWYFGLTPPHVSLCYTSRAIKCGGKYATDYSISADYDYIIRLYKSGMHFERVVGFRVRQELGGVSNRGLRALLKSFNEDKQVLKSHGVRWRFSTAVIKKILKIRQLKW